MTDQPSGLAQRVEATLDDRVRPYLRGHLGDVTVKGIDEGVVTVEFEHQCAHFPAAAATLHARLEPALTELEGISSVRAVGVHASVHSVSRIREMFSITPATPATTPAERTRASGDTA